MQVMFPPLRAAGQTPREATICCVRRRSAARSLVLLCACAAAVLRVWGIDFGLPAVIAHPDESRVARTSLDFLSGNLHPGFFNYPTLFMYLNGAAYLGYCSARTVTGHFSSIAACVASWPAAYEPFFLIARLISALAGTSAVVLVFHIGSRTADRATGVIASLYTAVAFLHVRDSHFGVTDVTMTTLVLLALLALIRAHEAPSIRRFALAGTVAGLAVSAKYNAVLLLAPLLVSAWLHWIERRANGSRLDWRLPVFGAAMTVAFLAGTPYAALDPARFWQDVTGEAAHLAAGHSVFLGVGWIYHARVTLRYGLTLPLLLSGLAGAVLLSVRRPRSAGLLLAFPVLYYIVAGRGHTVFARYMVPLVPFVCVTAGYFTASLARVLTRRTDSRAVVPSAAAIALAIAAPSLVKAVQMDRVLARPDSRGLASAWIAAHVPPGASIFLTGSSPGQPDLWRGRVAPPWRIWRYDEPRRGFTTPAGFTSSWPDWIVVQESPLVAYSSVPSGVRAELTRYDLRQSFIALSMSTPHVFDQQDAFYLPLDGFARVARPGPNLYAYERRR